MSQPDQGVVKAPFSPDQVRWINAYQRSGAFQPLTCPNLHKSRILAAEPEGMVCTKRPRCSYTQSWVPAFVVDPRWERRTKAVEE